MLFLHLFAVVVIGRRRPPPPTHTWIGIHGSLLGSGVRRSVRGMYVWYVVCGCVVVSCGAPARILHSFPASESGLVWGLVIFQHPC